MEYENVEQTAPVIPAKPQSNPIVRYAIIGVIAVVALALVISIIAALIPGKFGVRDGNSIDWATNDDGERVFVFNGNKLVVIDEDISKEIESTGTDYNQKYAVFTTERKETKDGKYKYGDLYVVNNKTFKKVADEVSSFRLSAFGDTLIYIADGDLYFAQLSNPAKAKKVDSDVSGISAVSPDGKTVAYYQIDEKDSDEEDEEDEETTISVDTFISKNGKKGEKFSKKDSTIFAISNNAKYVYYKKDSKCFVNGTKIADSDDFYSYYSFNRDASQIIYSAKSSKGEYNTYIINKAGEKVSIGDGAFDDVLSPSGTYSRYCYNTASFAKCAVNVHDGDDSVYYYLKNVKSSGAKIGAMKNATGVNLLDDCKTVLFVKKGDLRTMSITKPDAEPKTYSGFEEDVASYDVSADGKHIYVRDDDKTLYYVKSLKKALKIQEDVSGFICFNDGSVYFMNDDDEFCYAKKSAKVKVITDELDGIGDVDYVANVITIVSEDQYGVVNGAKFKKLFDVKSSKSPEE